MNLRKYSNSTTEYIYYNMQVCQRPLASDSYNEPNAIAKVQSGASDVKCFPSFFRLRAQKKVSKVI